MFVCMKKAAPGVSVRLGEAWQKLQRSAFQGTMKKQQLRPNNTWQTCQRHKSRKLARRAKVNTGDVSPSELLTRLHCFWARAALRKRRSCRSACFFPNCTNKMAKITAASRARGRGSCFPTEWMRPSPPGPLLGNTSVLLVHEKQRKVPPFVAQRLKFEKKKVIY